MHTTVRSAIGVALALVPPLVAGATSSDVAALRKEIEALKQAYESRIEALEQKLKTVEQEQAAQAARAPAPSTAPQASAARTGQVTAGTAFNPQLSVILDGVFYSDNQGGNGAGMLGEAAGVFPGQGEGGLHQGFNLRETEIAFSATVDPYFDAAVNLSVGADGDVALEEAYGQTRSLPAGLRVKAGKFLSDIGYVNSQHPHQWDFVDQNLPYLALFGPEGLTDTGAQVTWLPDWPLYTLFGVEASQNTNLERLGVVADDTDRELYGLPREVHGPQFYTGFVKVSPDLGADHALQLGTWLAHFRQHQEVQNEGDTVRAFDGQAQAWGLDAVYKYSAGLGYGHGDWKVQAEYLRGTKDLDLAFSNTGEEGWLKGTQDGYYVQGWYGFAPRWRAGLRYDTVGLTNRLTGIESVDLDPSDRWTVDVSWLLSEYSQLRVQFETADLALAEGGDERVNAVYLQYVLSLGAHGAHKF